MRIEGRAAFPTEIAPCQVVVSGDTIANVVVDPAAFEPADLSLREDLMLCPGFIDAQINGGFGKEFKTDEDAVEHVSSQITRFGVTSFLPTVTTREVSTYRDHLASLMNQYSGPGPNARVLGLHLEGPVLNISKKGAHPAEWLKEPGEIDLDSILTDDVRMVTIAPELPDGWNLARTILDRGLRLGLGHSTAGYDDVVANVLHPAAHIVHVFNAMGELTAREPGLVGVALARPDFPASVVADLVHVHPANLRSLWMARSGQHIFGVSDGSAVLGLPEGIHKIGSREIERRSDRAVLKGTETLVGSVLTMNVAARNMVNNVGCTVVDAINFVSLNTADYLGVSDRLGSIEVGKLADLCVIDSNFEVHMTMVNGVVAYQEI